MKITKLDGDEWLFSQQLNPLEEIEKGNRGEKIFISDILEMYSEDHFSSKHTF
ncbi:hypothetical protein ACFQZJ_05255 [Maribacter chungangensis]|uniref:Uncharacterized protein n=1 Tax=Maribacter chungangensis TaxID=1069117 RepID=A0ABW3B0L0_9FLAO